MSKTGLLPRLLAASLLAAQPAAASCDLARAAAGTTHALAVAADGAVWSWGTGHGGELGSPGLTESPLPLPNGVTGAVGVAAGDDFSLALLGDGSVLAWGSGPWGEIGDGRRAGAPDPVVVPGLPLVAAVAAGSHHALALGSDGSIWAWGAGVHGQLGDGVRRDRDLPVRVQLPLPARAIAAGGEHSLAIDDGGGVWSWGANDLGQLGDGQGAAAARADSPVALAGLPEAIAVAAGLAHSLALGADGTVWAWGGNGRGALGDGSGRDSPVPVALAAPAPVVAIAAGDHHSLALAADGTLWAWGANRRGALGSGDLLDSLLPRPVAALGTGTFAVAGGENCSLALVGSGGLRAWGGNESYQLGDSTRADALLPVGGAATDPVPPDQGNVLRAVRAGDGIRLDFSGAPASIWRVFRDPGPDLLGTTPAGADVGAPTYLDEGALLRAGTDYYYLRGLSPCSLIPGP